MGRVITHHPTRLMRGELSPKVTRVVALFVFAGKKTCRIGVFSHRTSGFDERKSGSFPGTKQKRPHCLSIKCHRNRLHLREREKTLFFGREFHVVSVRFLRVTVTEDEERDRDRGKKEKRRERFGGGGGNSGMRSWQ